MVFQAVGLAFECAQEICNRRPQHDTEIVDGKVRFAGLERTASDVDQRLLSWHVSSLSFPVSPQGRNAPACSSLHPAVALEMPQATEAYDARLYVDCRQYVNSYRAIFVDSIS